MELIYTSKNGGSQGITDIVGTINIRGSLEQVSRTLDFDLIRPDADAFMPKVNIELGSTITILDDGEEVYSGVVWFRDFDDNSITQRITAYDIALYTNKSEPDTQVFKNMSCSAIASSVLGELGLPVGDLAPGITLTLNGRNKTAYEIIMGAYTKASQKTKKKYHMVVKDGKVNVIEKDESIETKVEYREEALPGTIIGVNYEESIDNMINKVKVINDKKKDEKKDAKENNEDVKNFGLVQKVLYGKEEDTEGILESACVEVDLECFGDFSMRTGYSLELETKLVSGKYYIKADEHSINDGIHKCKLKLVKENEMNEVVFDE